MNKLKDWLFALAMIVGALAFLYVLFHLGVGTA
jgi:hypothetical protein